jgi:alpha-mannosidase
MALLHSIRWTPEKIRQRLAVAERMVYRRNAQIPPFRMLELESSLVHPPVSPEVDSRSWPTIPFGAHWGKPDTNFVLRSSFQTPSHWPTTAPVALYLPLGDAGEFSHPEALVYIDSQPVAACDRHHQEILLPVEYCDGAEHILALHGWTGGRSAGYGDPGSSEYPDTMATLRMRACQVVLIDEATRAFVALARVALGAADELGDDDPIRGHLYGALDAAFQALDTREPLGEQFYASVPAAHQVLRDAVAKSGTPLDVEITAAGHAHIDVAWLWTLGQTRRKAQRTFYNVLRLMEQYPEFRFTQSQPQLYDYVRQDDPTLFVSVCKQVAEGRWEPVGGTWVEVDCNLSGAESLARQFLLGLAFLKKAFGEKGETPVLWLPDVFGYAWNLPQLIKEAGLHYFFTIKIGWSQYNRLPYDSFWWQGLDGTRILTHFSTTKEKGRGYASTYNAAATPDQVLSTWTNFQQKDWGLPGEAPPLLMSYGYGDGGGGPTREMVENIRELAKFPGMPRVRFGSVAEFFRELEERSGDRLPTWNGELYLEYHRGTYTTQARSKRANRKSEFLLHDAEFLAAQAALLDPGYAYPYTELRRAWELVCLNQFHDIIPGSSIGPVYEESLAQYAEVQELGVRVRNKALEVTAAHVTGDLLVVNPTSFQRSDPAFWAGHDATEVTLRRASGARVMTQKVAGGLLLDTGPLPPYSVTSLDLGKAGTARKQASAQIGVLAATPQLLENDLVLVEFDENGDIFRIFDKVHARDILPPGAVANQFQLFEDRPMRWDAWDIEIYYDDRMWLAEPAALVTVEEEGPLRATLRVRRVAGRSLIDQRISLTHNSPRIDFETEIDWRERHTLLKVAFPLDLLSPVATYEIQWGNVERPTHRNRSWDWAQFETCAHKWVDLSEGDYGVSLLNDCKYGHDIHENVMRLTLLRSPTDPDPEADQGEHHFTYSLLPHAGRWDEFTVAQAYALNEPLLVWPDGEVQTQAVEPSQPVADTVPAFFVAVDRPNIVIETVKQAEDGQGVIVRVYESQRQRGTFALKTGFPLAEVWRTDLLEAKQVQIPCSDHSVEVPFRPYQILTLRLVPA